MHTKLFFHLCYIVMLTASYSIRAMQHADGFLTLTVHDGIESNIERKQNIAQTPTRHHKQAQYAQAPTGHPEVERILRQSAATYEQAKSDAEKTQKHAPTKRNTRSETYDSFLADVTDIIEIQKLIRAYAFNITDAEHTSMYKAIRYNFSTHNDVTQIFIPQKQKLVRMAATDTADGFIIATLHNDINTVKLHTMYGKRVNHTFPWYPGDLFFEDKSNINQCLQKYKPCTYLSCIGSCLLLGPCLPVHIASCITDCCITPTLICSTFPCVSTCAHHTRVGNFMYLNSAYDDLNSCLCHTRPPQVKTIITAIAFQNNKTIITGMTTFAHSWDACKQFCGAPNRCCSAPREVHTLDVWSLDGTLQKTIEAHNAPITAIETTPDGTIITGSQDTTVKIWKGDAPPIILTGHTSPIKAISTIRNKQFRTFDMNATVKSWNHIGKCGWTAHLSDDGISLIQRSVNHNGSIASSRLQNPITQARCDVVKIAFRNKEPLKIFFLPGDIYDVCACLDLPDKTIIIGTETGHLLAWQPFPLKVDGTPDDKQNQTKLLRHRDNCAVVGISPLKDGAFAVAWSDGLVECIMHDDNASHFLSQCTLQQLAFIKEIIRISEEYPDQVIPLAGKQKDLFMTLPAYVRAALQHNCPKLQIPTDCCSNVRLCP